MIDVIVVGEGPTEETFVRDVLAPTLWDRGIFVEPRLISTSRISSGGSLNRERVLRHLRNTLRQRSDVYVTTFFDLYRLPGDFPGVSSAASVADPLERAALVESELAAQTIGVAGCSPHRFFPHIQPFEFEALVFADVSRLPEIRSDWTAFVEVLHRVRTAVSSPEHIDDGEETHPAAHLRKLNPRYEKVLHGAAATKRIGLERIRAECAHFAGWLGRIEALTAREIEA